MPDTVVAELTAVLGAAAVSSSGTGRSTTAVDELSALLDRARRSGAGLRLVPHAPPSRRIAAATTVVALAALAGGLMTTLSGAHDPGHSTALAQPPAGSRSAIADPGLGQVPLRPGAVPVVAPPVVAPTMASRVPPAAVTTRSDSVDDAGAGSDASGPDEPTATRRPASNPDTATSSPDTARHNGDGRAQDRHGGGSDRSEQSHDEDRHGHDDSDGRDSDGSGDPGGNDDRS